jgi:hypothetical protein
MNRRSFGSSSVTVDRAVRRVSFSGCAARISGDEAGQRRSAAQLKRNANGGSAPDYRRVRGMRLGRTAATGGSAAGSRR